VHNGQKDSILLITGHNNAYISADINVYISVHNNVYVILHNDGTVIYFIFSLT
jgi:hypothetical protein